jgi:hypothetical protein
MFSKDLNMGTISGTTHLKAIFSFLPSTGEDFIGNTFCSSNNSFMQLNHILHLFLINSIFYKRPKDLENARAKELGPLFLSNGQKTPCPEGHEHGGRSEVVHHLTGKLFLHE